MDRPMCRHCDWRRSMVNKRGLCYACYNTPSLRAKYLSQSKYAPNSAKGVPAEPTEAEVEALVAEQMANLPPWWDESRSDGYGTRGPETKPPVERPPRSLKRGRVARRLA